MPVAEQGARMAGLEYMQAVASGGVPAPPIAVLMRMRPIEVDRDIRGILQAAGCPEKRSPKWLREPATSENLLFFVQSKIHQRTLNQRVQGSSPCAPTKEIKDITCITTSDLLCR